MTAVVALLALVATVPAAVPPGIDLTPTRWTGSTTELTAQRVDVPVSVSSAPASVSATGSLPIYGYSETLYHLPGYNPMSSFLKNMNGKDRQIPTLASSPSQPAGVYYVDNSSNLDLLYLNNSTVRTIAHVVSLYQLYAYNEMLDNEFFLEYNYDEALFFGTTTAGGDTYSIETVNLTTGSVLMWNTTSLVDSTNQEPIYVGNQTVIVVSSNDTIVGYNLASHERWNAGSTSNFEANNIYWIPQVQQLINVEAGGKSTDGVQQLNASDDSLGRIKFSTVASITVDSGVPFDFVNGIGYNATLRQLAFSAGHFKGNTVYSYVLQYQPSYVLSSSPVTKYTVLPGGSPQLFNGQRYVYTSEYVLGRNVDGIQYLFDPWTGASLPTNRTFQEGVACSNACFEGTYAPSQNRMLDYNASLRNESAFYNVVYAYCSGEVSSPGTSEVTFTETGLPIGSAWYLNVTRGPSVESTTTSATADLQNGTYAYTVATVDKEYKPLPSGGLLTVAGTPLTESVTFSLVTYPVTFAEAGLLVGSTWYVNITGSQPHSSTGSTVNFTEPNGTYDYAVTTGDKEYAPAPAWGSFSVSGALVSETASFSLETYVVTLTERGLPSGTNWTATVDGTLHASTTTTIRFAEPNGTYPFSVGRAAGYTINPSFGSIAVNGSPYQRSITFTSTSSGVSATGEYVLLGATAAAVVVATAVTVLLIRRRGKSRPPPRPSLSSPRGGPPPPPLK